MPKLSPFPMCRSLMPTSQAVIQRITLNLLVSSRFCLVVPKGDMLQMVTKYALQVNLSFKGLTSLVEMISSLLDSPVLPHSKYPMHKASNGPGDSTSLLPQMLCIGGGAPDTSLACPECKHLCGSPALQRAPFLHLSTFPLKFRSSWRGVMFWIRHSTLSSMAPWVT